MLLSRRLLPLRRTRRSGSALLGRRSAPAGGRRGDRHRPAAIGIAFLPGDTSRRTKRDMRGGSAMQRIGIIIAGFLSLAVAWPATAQQKATLNLVTAGDQNMVDYVKDYLAPIFEKEHPGIAVKAVGTGPGDAGSQKIYEKLGAEKDNNSWDIFVSLCQQKAAGEVG